MAKLPLTYKLILEDFPKEVRNWAGKLLYPINTFFESVYAALNKGLTFTDNFDAQLKHITVDGNYPISFEYTTSVRPMGIICVYAKARDASYPLGGIFVSFEIIEKSVKINNITGLDPSKKYDLKLLLITG